MSAAPICCVEARRQIDRDKGWNGIDYVEVGDDQRTLCVHFFGDVPAGFTAANVVIEGGRRIRNVRVVKVYAEHEDDPEVEECLRVIVDRAGDFSTYTLRLVGLGPDGRPTGKPPEGFDARYSKIDFSFKINCPSDLDCAEGPCDTAPDPAPAPAIDYLAKDYGSFRRLILDRLALVMPAWTERHVPDLGIALVEVLAYVGDYLSYYQDAVGTEAYLGTARKRISVRRHARLVDYALHEGCNTRVWLVLAPGADMTLDLRRVFFVTAAPEMSQLDHAIPTELEIASIPLDRYESFAAMWQGSPSVDLRVSKREIHFHTWGDEDCILPRGATRASLVDVWKDPELAPRPGDVLLIEEVLGRETGLAVDADPARRWFVRLTEVQSVMDEVLEVPVLEITWAESDALPFDFCVTTMLPAPACTIQRNMTVARGNVVLADHGRRVKDDLGTVGSRATIEKCVCEGSQVDVTLVPETMRPILAKSGITFRQPLPPDAASVPASQIVIQDPRAALPDAWIDAAAPAPANDKPTVVRWLPRGDLLASEPYDTAFVLEVDDDRYGHVRFGDGDLGAIPGAGTSLTAGYRVGNGLAGNVEADTITRIVTRALDDGTQYTLSAELLVRNPLPARGGAEPEALADATLAIPHAFRRTLERAITADDYATLAERDPRVQRAGALLQWTGSWYEAHVSIDPLGTDEAAASVFAQIQDELERYRRLGHDLRVVPARYVPIDVTLLVCVQPNLLRAHVLADVAARLGSRALPGGARGFFHPDNLVIGRSICASDLIAAAQLVPGVDHVELKVLKRAFEAGDALPPDGVLRFAPFEVAQLDSDPSFPERGRLTIQMGGGR